MSPSERKDAALALLERAGHHMETAVRLLDLALVLGRAYEYTGPERKGAP